MAAFVPYHYKRGDILWKDIIYDTNAELCRHVIGIYPTFMKQTVFCTYVADTVKHVLQNQRICFVALNIRGDVRRRTESTRVVVLKAEVTWHYQLDCCADVLLEEQKKLKMETWNTLLCDPNVTWWSRGWNEVGKETSCDNIVARYSSINKT